MGSLHTGGEGVHFRLVNAEGILKHDARQWWVGGKESHSQLRHHCIADMRRYERGVGTVCVIRESVYIVWIELLQLHIWPFLTINIRIRHTQMCRAVYSVSSSSAVDQRLRAVDFGEKSKNQLQRKK